MTERVAEMLLNLRNDVRYALRTLTRNPGFAAAAIAPIALGIGINTGVFSVLNSVAWRALPVPDADALVSIYQDFRGGPRRTVYGARSLFSIHEYRAYRDESHTLSGVMAYSREWTVTIGRESPREIAGILVTCNYFDVLGLSAAIGTNFTPANCGTAEAQPVVVLSHALWEGAFGGDPQILQRPIVLNGQNVTVVGVAPAGFAGIDMARASFFAPTSMAGLFRPEQDLQANANVSWLTLIGRRRSGANIAQVRADLAVVAGRIDRQQPGRTTSLIVEPAAALSLPVARRNVLRGASIVMAAFGLVLLMAAANVANMLLARAAARTREIAIRVSVGATRGRLVQQLLTESALIAFAGALCGSLLFWWSFQALIPWLLSSVPGGEAARVDATPDLTVLWFALGLAATTALLFGLAPALQASKSDTHAVMKQDGAGSKGGRGWLRGTLIGAQIALCTMLLIPAGLLTRALYAAQSFDPGFDHRNVAVVGIDLRGPRFEKGGVETFREQWLERIRALPDVERIAEASRIPLSPGRSLTTLRLGDEPEGRLADVNTVSPEFFSLLGLPIVRGRVFADGETDAALVTESTARRYWPGQDAIGRTVTIDGRRRHIVGVVRDAQVSQTQDAISSYVYLPAARGSQRGISVLVRTRTDVDAFAAAVRAETSRMDAGLVVNVQPLSNNLALLQTLSQITASVAGTLSLLALGLAAIGIYGVVAYTVTRRRREVGIRMALGATARDVRWLILGQTMRPVAAGMAIGLAVAAAAARVLRAVLFGVSPFDPVAYLGAPLMMMAVAALATWLPTRQALQTDPVSLITHQ
jgi:putative ABC transport system permease protein